MLRIPILSRKESIILLTVYIALGLTTLTLHASYMLMITLMVWLLLVTITVRDLKNNVASFCFLISIFVFLLGREVCFNYLGVPVYYIFLTKENDFAFACLIISMVGLLVGNSISIKKENEDIISVDYTSTYISCLKEVSKYACIICFIFQFISIFLQIAYVRRVGYISSYSEDSGGAGVPAVISYVGAFLPIALFIYLTSKPAKKEAMIALFMYEVYAFFTLLSGKRFPFVAINMLILVYMTIRNRDEGGWISKKVVFLIVGSLPMMLVFLAAYDSVRIGQSFSFTSITDSIISFFDNQGGSINVIKRVRYYDEELSDLKYCSFNGTRTLLFENLVTRKLFDLKIYSGNSIEYALKGHSLAHRLSYYNFGLEYLKGRGVGSCYIAELYHDFGYLGVFVGSVVYGRLFRAINYMKFSHPVKDGLLLAMLYYILLAPRGGFDSFVNNVFGLYTLLGLVVILYFTRVLQKKIDRIYIMNDEKC